MQVSRCRSVGEGASWAPAPAPGAWERAVVHDEDPAHVQLDVVLALLVLEEVEGGALGDEEEGLELELALHGEVLDSQVLLPVVRQRLVELA